MGAGIDNQAGDPQQPPFSSGPTAGKRSNGRVDDRSIMPPPPSKLSREGTRNKDSSANLTHLKAATDKLTDESGPGAYGQWGMHPSDPDQHPGPAGAGAWPGGGRARVASSGPLQHMMPGGYPLPPPNGAWPHPDWDAMPPMNSRGHMPYPGMNPYSLYNQQIEGWNGMGGPGSHDGPTASPSPSNTALAMWLQQQQAAFSQWMMQPHSGAAHAQAHAAAAQQGNVRPPLLPTPPPAAQKPAPTPSQPPRQSKSQKPTPKRTEAPEKPDKWQKQRRNGESRDGAFVPPEKLASFQNYLGNHRFQRPIPLPTPPRSEAGEKIDRAQPLPVPFPGPPGLNNQMLVNQMMVNMSMYGAFQMANAMNFDRKGPAVRPGVGSDGLEVQRAVEELGMEQKKLHASEPHSTSGGSQKRRSDRRDDSPQALPPHARRRHSNGSRGVDTKSTKSSPRTASLQEQGGQPSNMKHSGNDARSNGDYAAAVAAAMGRFSSGGPPGSPYEPQPNINSSQGMSGQMKPSRNAAALSGGGPSNDRGVPSGNDDESMEDMEQQHRHHRNDKRPRHTQSPVMEGAGGEPSSLKRSAAPHFLSAPHSGNKNPRQVKRRKHRGDPNSPTRSVGSGASSSGFQGDYRSGGEEAHCPHQQHVGSLPHEDFATGPTSNGGGPPVSSISYLFQVTRPCLAFPGLACTSPLPDSAFHSDSWSFCSASLSLILNSCYSRECCAPLCLCAPFYFL